jgi:hypothetical protein
MWQNLNLGDEKHLEDSVKSRDKLVTRTSKTKFTIMLLLPSCKILSGDSD